MRIVWASIIVSAILSIIAATAVDIWLSGRIAIVGSFVGLQYALNPGIAWGIQFPSGVQEGLIFVALITVGYMAWKTCKSLPPTSYPLPPIAYGMIIGGGMGNIVDRLRDGYVTDYVQIGTFPIFNVADTFVTIGVGILLFEAIYTQYVIRNT